MITGKPIRIVSMGTYLPHEFSSEEVESLHGIPAGWSNKYSGVSTRRHVTTESNGYMGARAAEKALASSGMALSDIDMLISASGSYDYPIPNQASIIKNELEGGKDLDFPAIDVDSTCLSFIAALDFAARSLDGNDLKNILIVSSEIASKGLDHNNWETTTLFGDAAVAAIVSYDPESDSLFIKGVQKTYSQGVTFAMIEGGGNEKNFKDHKYNAEMHSFKMEGKKMLRLAKDKLPKFVNDFFRGLPLSIEDTDVIIPHQASKLGMSLFSNLFNFKKNAIKETLSIYGNCMAASVPLTLAHSIESGETKRGDVCLLIGTSAGFSIGSVLIKY
jgi:3-oxoacyl-[acyl-carrier-protein] synthase-3